MKRPIFVALACVFALSVTGAAASAQPAPPAPGKALVTLGDSYTTDAWVDLGPAPEGRQTRCAQAPQSWPNQTRALMGLAPGDLVDVSCTGSSIDSGPGYSLSQEAKIADRQGAFGPRTKVVAIQAGLNDSWAQNDPTLWMSLEPCVFNTVQGCGLEAAAQGRIADYRAVSAKRYADRVRPVIEYLRYYAPNARIVFVGYPELVPANQGFMCVSILGVGQYVQPRAEAVVEYLNRLDVAQREAAKELGVDFLDVRRLTAGHGLCAAEPWLNGALDPRSDLNGLPLHPSTRGNAVVADALVRLTRR